MFSNSNNTRSQMIDPATSYILVYRSRTNVNVDESAMQGIVSAAQIKNSRIGVSGFLLWKNGSVIQGLLGNRSSVDSLFLDIRQDPRHHHVAVLYEEHVEALTYPGWALKFIDMNRSAVSPPDWKIINAGIPEHLRLIMFSAL
jgi:Sensors of blue-light using FAD